MNNVFVLRYLLTFFFVNLNKDSVVIDNFNTEEEMRIRRIELKLQTKIIPAHLHCLPFFILLTLSKRP
jgi:hypothetical protein